MHNIRLRYATLLGSALLAACGGGGGGGSSSGPLGPTQFTSFSAVRPNQLVQASAVAQTANVTTDVSNTVISRTVNAAEVNSANASLQYGPSTQVTGFSFFASGSTVSWSGSEATCDSAGCAGNKSGASSALLLPSGAITWNYQSFGYWVAGAVGGNAVAGAISFGSPTVMSAIPTSGTATYTGTAGGIYVNPAGATFEHAAAMSSTANFGTRSIAFSTFNTFLTTTNVPVSSPQLDLTGTLTYGSSANQFTGAVTAPGTPSLSGTATGRFYGPNAEEIGGVIGLSGTGGRETLLSGFGGKR